MSTALAEPSALAAFFAAAPEAMLVVDGSGAITLANARAEELFAYAAGMLAARSVDALVPSSLAISHARHRRGHLAEPRTRAMGESLDLRGRRGDGSSRSTSRSATPRSTASDTWSRSSATSPTASCTRTSCATSASTTP